MMKSKLPQNIISNLEEQEDENEEWTVDIFRKRLKRYITTQEAGEYQSRLNHSRIENIFRKNANSPSFSESPLRYTHGALLSSEFSPPHKSAKYIFCGGRHWNDECYNFSDFISMKRGLKERCFIFFKRSLYPNKFGITKKPVIKRSRNNEKKHFAQTQRGENTVIQTPLATVENPEILNRKERRMLMDTGSQRKHITKEFTDKNVQFIHSETKSQKNNNIISQIKYQNSKRR